MNKYLCTYVLCIPVRSKRNHAKKASDRSEKLNQVHQVQEKMKLMKVSLYFVY